MKKNWKKWAAFGVSAVMFITAVGCNGKNSDRNNGLGRNNGNQAEFKTMNPKEFVYKAQKLNIDEDGHNIELMRKIDDRIYAVYSEATYDETTNTDDTKLVLTSMNLQGGDTKKIEMQAPTLRDLEEQNADSPRRGQSAETKKIAESVSEQADISTVDDSDPENDTEIDAEEMNDVESRKMMYGSDPVSMPISVYEIPEGEDGDIPDSTYTEFRNIDLGKDYILAFYTTVKTHYDKQTDIFDNTWLYDIVEYDYEGNLKKQISIEPGRYFDNSEDSDWYGINSLTKTTDGRYAIILYGSESGIVYVTEDGKTTELKKIKNLDHTMDFQVVSRGDGTAYLYYMDDEEDWQIKFSILDCTSAKVTKTFDTPQEISTKGVYRFSFFDENGIIFSTMDGIYSFRLGDATCKKRMDFVNSDFDCDELSSICYIDEEHFIANYWQPSAEELVTSLFTYVRPEDIKDKVTLVLAGQDISYSDIRRNVIRFNEENDTYRIVLKDYGDLNTVQDYSIGTTRLNNDIIAGNIPDIIYINDSSQIPVKSFIEKGMLADIDALIQADPELSKQEYMENVFDAYRVNGKLYQLIPSFILRTWIGKKSIFGDSTSITMEELKKIKQTMPDDTRIFREDITKEQFMETVMNFCGNDFIDMDAGTCKFDSALFKDLLEFAKSLPSDEEMENKGNDYWDAIMENYETQYRQNKTLLKESYFYDAHDIKYEMNGYFGETVSFVGFPSENGNGSFIYDTGTFAISAKSENIDGAWQFLRVYLGSDYQERKNGIYGYRNGMSVVKSIVKQNVMDQKERPFWEYGDGEKEYYDDTFWINGQEITVNVLTDQEANDVFDMICSVNRTGFNNESIMEIISDASTGMLEGSKSVDDVTAEIQNRVGLFLKENK